MTRLIALAVLALPLAAGPALAAEGGPARGIETERYQRDNATKVSPGISSKYGMTAWQVS